MACLIVLCVPFVQGATHSVHHMGVDMGAAQYGYPCYVVNTSRVGFLLDMTAR